MQRRLEVNKTPRGRMNFEGWLLNKHINFATKLQKNDANLRPEKNTQKKPKNLILERLGLNLGRVWDALGRLGATFGRILTVCWTFQIIFL